RNRENQRLSRQRKNEYVQELEEEVRKYRSEGVEVSQAIQIAARCVLEENQRLRNLLAVKGVTGDEIKKY
ncbi:hypothetical protein K432DRAFT_252701, partial [Lepidopterella palustris CBS 459.81]